VWGKKEKKTTNGAGLRSHASSFRFPQKKRSVRTKTRTSFFFVPHEYLIDIARAILFVFESEKRGEIQTSWCSEKKKEGVVLFVKYTCVFIFVIVFLNFIFLLFSFFKNRGSQHPKEKKKCEQI
jgi:hypothetical protein